MAEVEDILAEPEEPSAIQSSLVKVSDIISSNGWYIVGIAAIAYYVYQNYIKSRLTEVGHVLHAPEDNAPQKAKDDARREAVLRLQEKYAKESEERARKLKELEEKKTKERLAEIDRLEKIRGEQRLGGTEKKSFRPEYNPLMGDTSSSRVCFRPSGGRQGG